MPRPHTIPVNAESPGVRFRHQYFLKFPRWFQCANKFENWWLIRLWGNYLTSLSLTLMDIVIKIMYVHKQRISMVTTSLPSTTTTPSNIISGIISFLPAFLFSCLPPSFPFFPLHLLQQLFPDGGLQPSATLRSSSASNLIKLFSQTTIIGLENVL